mgnify:CR=1 FL=1
MIRNIRYKQEVIDKVLELKSEGVTHREISRIVFGKPSAASSVHYIIKSAMAQQEEEMLLEERTGASTDTHELPIGYPKILFLDIETAPMLVRNWSLWQQYTSLEQLQVDWFIMSWAAKWGHSDEVFYEDVRDCVEDETDESILQGIWTLLDEADIIVTQNGKKFDEKKLNARFIMNGYQPPSSYKHVDTLQIAKSRFGFTSNKLAYMTDVLNTKFKKLDHAKYQGYSLWDECLKGNLDAWDEMEEYNRYDVLSLQELYEKLRAWDKRHPSTQVYTSTDKMHCSCGSTDLVKNGFVYTNLSKFQRYRCNGCGSEVRGRKNLLHPEKRKSLTMNIQ